VVAVVGTAIMLNLVALAVVVHLTEMVELETRQQHLLHRVTMEETEIKSLSLLAVAVALVVLV
jgi:Pyruvate/2-oxoacid:ferredoxin oxidoreductase gamma subunit